MLIEPEFQFRGSLRQALYGICVLFSLPEVHGNRNARYGDSHRPLKHDVSKNSQRNASEGGLTRERLERCRDFIKAECGGGTY
jgi:hypothetical protein